MFVYDNITVQCLNFGHPLVTTMSICKYAKYIFRFFQPSAECCFTLSFSCYLTLSFSWQAHGKVSFQPILQRSPLRHRHFNLTSRSGGPSCHREGRATIFSLRATLSYELPEFPQEALKYTF